MRLAASIPLALGLALTTAPSLAADQEVHAGAGGYTAFSPSTVTILQGETVTWKNDGGTHNVHFDDNSFQDPPAPSSASWTVQRSFQTAGTYKYRCDNHGIYMTGTVVVQAPGGGGDTTAPDIDSLRVTPATFCNKASDKCPKRGARLRFTIDEDAEVTGSIIRRKDGVKVGSLKVDAKSGANDFKFTGKGLKLGKYRLDLVAEDASSNKSPVNKTGFKIATKR
jgi:plastocyanin